MQTKKTRNVTPDVPKVVAFNEEDIGALKEYAEKTMSIIVSTSGYSRGAQLISNKRELRCETVPFKADAYTFRYMDMVMAYAMSRLELSDDVTNTLCRDGKFID